VEGWGGGEREREKRRQGIGRTAVEQKGF